MPSVTRTRRGVAERRAAVEHQVLEAVERLLAGGESYTALGIQRIAEEAGMARTTFYGHFRDKTTLLMRLAESVASDLFAGANAWVRDDDAGLAQLESTLLDLVRGYREHEPLLRAVLEVAAYEPEIERFWRALVHSFEQPLCERIVRDQAAGRVAKEVDAPTVAFFIAWGTERSVAAHAATRPPHDDERFAKGIAAAGWAATGRV